MGNNPRRIYIYPRIEQDDGVAANFWPPGANDLSRSSDDQPQYASSDYPESDPDQGGGLLGMLLRGMQQDRDQPDVDSNSGANSGSGVDSGNDGTPQGGLLGRLLAVQAQQNQLFAGNNAQLPSEPVNPDIRKLTRVTAPQRMANNPSDRSDDQSNSSYSPSNSPAPPLTTRPGDQAAQSDRSLSDQLQAYWDHPHPYGVVMQLKRILNGMALAVQSSIDARRVPLTEEDVFRQDWSREHGPIVAWEALSGLRSITPRGVGGILGRPLIDAITSREPSPQAILGDKIATPQSVVPLNPNLPVSKPSGGLFGPYSGKPTLPWIPDAPGIQAGLDVIEAGRKRYREPLPRGVNLLNYKPAPKKPYGSQGGLGGGGGPRKGISGDPDDPCNDLHIKEQNRCIERLHNEEYADVRHFGGCMETAAERMRLCYKTGRPPTDPPEWTPEHEEIYNRDFRIKKPRSD